MWWRRRRTSADFTSEIASHLELEAERLQAEEGLGLEEARLAARRRFGNVTRVSERFYESRRVLWWDHLRQDARSAIRSIAKSPVACLVAVASLAGGIGATTATLTLRNAIFYNPPPLYAQPSELSRVEISTPERRRGGIPGPLYETWLADGVWQGRMAAATAPRGFEIRVGDRVETRPVRAGTADLFAILGVPLAQGRSFPAAPETDGPPPLIISFAVWQTLFDGRPDVIGTTVWVDQRAHTVIGVTPYRFWFGSLQAPLWTHLPREGVATQPALDVIVRRPSQLSTAALAEQLQHSAEPYRRRQPAAARDLRVVASQIGGTGLGDQMAEVIPYLVGAAVLLTLLISCANVAILMFARWTGREREMAIRSSLGARRGRVVQLLLTESVLLAIAGGVLGVCTTFALRGVFLRNMRGAANFDLSIDSVILLQSAAVTIAAGILAGIAPALYETRRLQANPLRLIATSDRARQRWRHTLVVLEISVTVALMVVAAGQIDASRRMLSSNLGFPTAPLMTARVENPGGVDVARVLDVLEAMPGVESAGAGTALPMAVGAPTERVSAAPGSIVVAAERVSITPAYFTTLDVPMRAGRTFTAADAQGPPRVAIINETLARQLWGDRNIVGDRITAGGNAYEIVGIVAGYASDPMRGPVPRYYLPFAFEPAPARMQVFLRATHDPRPLVTRFRQEVRHLGPAYSVPAAFALDDVIVVGAKEILVFAAAMSPLLAIGMFLTATGIFGVLAFAIARRAKELALRIALGASRSEVVRVVIVQTLGLLTIGSALGVAVTFGLSRMAAAAGGGGSSFGTPGWEAFAIPVLIVLGVGALASWFPIARALRIDPAMLLRTE
jgi:putative ABC transport system permease protein